MIFRLITGVGFLVLAGIIVFIGGIGRSLGGLALVTVMLILGITLIITAYFQPHLSNKKSRVSSIVNSPLRALYNSRSKIGLLVGCVFVCLLIFLL